MAVLKIWGRDA